MSVFLSARASFSTFFHVWRVCMPDYSLDQTDTSLAKNMSKKTWLIGNSYKLQPLTLTGNLLLWKWTVYFNVCLTGPLHSSSFWLVPAGKAQVLLITLMTAHCRAGQCDCEPARTTTGPWNWGSYSNSVHINFIINTYFPNHFLVKPYWTRNVFSVMGFLQHSI